MQRNVDIEMYAEARRILRTLFFGMDPESHKRLSPECVVMQPEIKTALGLGVEALQIAQWMRRRKAKPAANRSSAAESSRSLKPCKPPSVPKKGPSRAGEGWSPQEDRDMSWAFDQGKKIRFIAQEHQRTSGTIAARLVRLGIVTSKQEARRAG